VAAPYKNTAPPAAEAYWLAAGYIAVSELDIAHAYLSEAQRLYPEDRRLQLLSAHLAYKQSDLSRARTILERMVREDPDEGLAQLNLGIVLKELDDPRSRQVLRDLQRRFSGTALAERAALELANR
jgi:predicted Zn-dependent protease